MKIDKKGLITKELSGIPQCQNCKPHFIMISAQDLVCLLIVIMPNILSLCEFEQCTYLEIPTWLQVASEVLGYTVMPLHSC